MEVLPKDILGFIVSIISDPQDFYNFSLVCSSLRKVCKEQEEIKKMEFSKEVFDFPELESFPLGSYEEINKFLFIRKERSYSLLGNYYEVRKYNILPNGWKHGKMIIKKMHFVSVPFNPYLEVDIIRNYSDDLLDGKYFRVIRLQGKTLTIKGEYSQGKKSSIFKREFEDRIS